MLLSGQYHLSSNLNPLTSIWNSKSLKNIYIKKEKIKKKENLVENEK